MNLDKILERFTCIGLFLFFILFFVFKNSYKLGFGLLFLVALINFVLIYKKKSFFKLNKENIKLILAWLSYGIILIGINIIHNNSFRDFKFGLLSLFTPLFFILFNRFYIKPIYFFILILCSTITATLIGIYNISILNYSRVTISRINTIHFSNIMQLFSFISLIGLSLSDRIKNETRKYLYIILSILAFIGGITMSFFSYSRGTWLAIPFQFILVSIYYYKPYKRIVILSTIMALFVTTLIYNIPKTGLKQRISLVNNDIQKYSRGNSYSSNGMRLELYKFGYYLFKESPIIGISEIDLEERRSSFPNKYKISSVIQNPHLGHFHNYFIQIIVTYGILGFLSLLLIYYFSFKIFLKQYKNEKNKEFGIVGLLLIVSFLIYNQTDLVLYWDIGFILFIVMLAILSSKNYKTLNK